MFNTSNTSFSLALLSLSFLVLLPGGHSHWKGVWGCAAVMTPFFQASRRSLAYQFTANAPLLCPLISIFRTFLHFQPCFGQNSSSLDPNFSKFSFPRPPFFKEKPLPSLYILKPAWHTSTKKKLSAPPSSPLSFLSPLFSFPPSLPFRSFSLHIFGAATAAMPHRFRRA